MVVGIEIDTADASADPVAPFVEEVLAGLESVLGSLGATTARSTIATSLNLDGGPEGDVAFPAHRAAAAARSPPDAFAARIAGAFPKSSRIPTVSAKGAYVNFSFAPSALTAATLGLIQTRGPEYGHRPVGGGAACVEHTSANPTGPFHIGRVRNAIIGDTLARVLRAAGRPVTTQYYVDDMGRQAAMVTWIWSKAERDWPEPIRKAVEGLGAPGEKADAARGRPYPAVSAYLKEHPEAQAEVADLVRQIELGVAPPGHRENAEAILGGMLESLARLGIRFDEFVWESDFLRDGSVERVLERMHHAPHAIREENGAWAIDATSYGLPKESNRVVFQRADGTSLYVLRDVAYHLAKFARFADVVDVLGQDHQLHVKTLDALLAELGERRRPSYLIYQDITVPEGGRMSTRKGSAVWLDQLLDEAVERARAEVLARREDLPESETDRIAEAVATGAIRFHIVRVAPEKPVVFRWEDALSFEGRSGPFAQYSYARASSVLRKAGVGPGPLPFEAERLSHPEELALVRLLARFPRAVAYAARTMHVQSLAGFAHDLADQFNRFYHAVPVLKSEEERSSRIALVAAVRQTLGNALDLLGVARLETM
ncbi:MAG TPA: arginine--tRNA ligase [Thermoplasmata archaeon]|nr:arginine--tRNA ligase [Thermoplasmata archaeon]